LGTEFFDAVDATWIKSWRCLAPVPGFVDCQPTSPFDAEP
jgi:hypothetical protein